MPGLSQRVVQIIESFAASMGLPARAAADGSFSFVFSRSGTLSLTSSEEGDRLLVSLARDPVRSDSDLEWRLLLQAGLDPATQTFLHSGMSPDGGLFHVMEFAEDDVDLPALDAVLRRLMEAHEELGAV
jgi:type III secretion system chaperone SycN